MNLIVTRGAAYEYRDTESGADLFSVSQIRKCAFDSYAGIPEQVLEPARYRGTLLHRRFWRVVAAQDQKLNVAWPALIPGLEPYCLAMDEWVKVNRPLPISLEQASANLKLGYAGTPDALVTYGKKQIIALIDLKTGTETQTDALQLHLYKAMEGYEKARKLIDLYVGENGKYREIERQTDHAAWAVALSSLNLLKWRKGL